MLQLSINWRDRDYNSARPTITEHVSALSSFYRLPFLWSGRARPIALGLMCAVSGCWPSIIAIDLSEAVAASPSCSALMYNVPHIVSYILANQMPVPYRVFWRAWEPCQEDYSIYYPCNSQFDPKIGFSLSPCRSVPSSVWILQLKSPGANLKSNDSKCQRKFKVIKWLTRSSTATFRTFHKNSRIPIIRATVQPEARTTKTPPTLSTPSSAALSDAADVSNLQRPWGWEIKSAIRMGGW